MRFVEISTQSEWEVGRLYRFVYSVEYRSVLGFDLPTFNKEKQVRDAIVALSERRELEIVSWRFQNDRLEVIVRAVQDASPVHVIVGIVLGIFLLFAVKLVIDSVGVAVESASDLTGSIADGIDATNLKLKFGETQFDLPLATTVIAGAVGFAIFVLVRRL